MGKRRKSRAGVKAKEAGADEEELNDYGRQFGDAVCCSFVLPVVVQVVVVLVVFPFSTCSSFLLFLLTPPLLAPHSSSLLLTPPHSSSLHLTPPLLLPILSPPP